MSDTLTLLTWLVKATALLILAMGITLGLRRAPAGARYLVWLATLVALLLAPAMSAWSPLPLAILPSDAPAIIAPASPAVSTPAVDAPAGGTQTAIRGASISAATSRSLSTSSAVLLAWASVVALLLAWLLLGAMSVRRILRGARTLADDAWLAPLYETADRLDLDRVPRLVMSAAIEMPFACSILRPTIVLPASAEQWSDARRRVVLFHELAHIRRRDLLGHTLGRIVCAFYWFHPLVWSAAKRLRAESERACDDLVLACGARASDYANHLLDIVTGVRRQGAPAMALPMANRREFEGRMLAILDPALKRAAPSRGQSVLLTAGLGLLSLTIAAVAPTRRVAPATDRQDVAVSRDSVEGDTALSRPVGSTATRTSTTKSVATRTSVSQSTVTQTDTAFTQVTDKRDWRLDLQDPQKRQPPDTALLGRILRTDKSAEVRKSAAWALQGRRDGVPLLLERLRIDEHASVREMAAWALADMPSSEVVAALAQALKGDKDDDVRGTAAWALGHMRGYADVSALEAALSDASADVRQKALWALGQQELPAAPARVVALLADRDNDVRMMAAWVLGEIQDRSTIPALREAFIKEGDAEVLQAEFRALVFMGDRSQAVIDRAMASENTELRSRAVRMIGGLGPGVWPWPWPWPWPRPEP